jgi:hypothetical protein
MECSIDLLVQGTSCVLSLNVRSQLLMFVSFKLWCINPEVLWMFWVFVDLIDIHGLIFVFIGVCACFVGAHCCWVVWDTYVSQIHWISPFHCHSLTDRYFISVHRLHMLVLMDWPGGPLDTQVHRFVHFSPCSFSAWNFKCSCKRIFSPLEEYWYIRG